MKKQMAFSKKDKALAKKSLVHWRSNLKKVESKKWAIEEYEMGAVKCALCKEYNGAYFECIKDKNCSMCPVYILSKSEDECGCGDNSIYDKIEKMTDCIEDYEDYEEKDNIASMLKEEYNITQESFINAIKEMIKLLERI